MKKTIREFVKEKLKDGKILSDCQIIDRYWTRYMVFWKCSAIAKKWESIRKTMWYLKNRREIEEVDRKEHGHSEEIFYKLV